MRSESDLFSPPDWHRGGRDWVVVDTAERPFPADLVSTSPAEPNVQSVSGLARITGEALGEVECQGAGLSLILSDLAVRAFALPVAKRTKPVQMLANVASRLPYASQEAVFDTWRGGSRWVLFAAVRGAVLRQYEGAVEAGRLPRLLGRRLRVSLEFRIGPRRWVASGENGRGGGRILGTHASTRSTLSRPLLPFGFSVGES